MGVDPDARLRARVPGQARPKRRPSSSCGRRTRAPTASGWPPTSTARARPSRGTWPSRSAPTRATANRVTFTEITRDAVQQAFEQPRRIDFDLVDAQQARRILDRLVGYELSPLLQKGLEALGPVGRPRAVRRAAADRGPRARDRGVRRPGVLERRRPPRRPNGGRAGVPGPADPGGRGEARGLARQEGPGALDAGGGRGPRRRGSATRPTAWGRSARARSSGRRRRRSPPRRCSRRPRASSGSRRARRCSSPSGCTRASTSPARGRSA